MGIGTKQDLYLSFLAVFSLVISIFILYPYTMRAENEGEFTMIFASILFYLLQLLSLVLAITIIGKSLVSLKSKRQYLSYLPLTIGVLLLMVFAFEVFWLIRKIS